MADNPDFPDDGPNHPSKPTEGDFPADFFDDVPESPPLAAAVAPSPREHPAPVTGAFGGATPQSPEALPYRTQPQPVQARPTMAYTPAEEPSPGTPVFPVMLGLMMLGGLALAIFVSTLKDEPAAAAAVVKPEAPATTAAPAVDDKLAGRIDGLDEQIKALQAKIDGLSKSEPVPDLKPIQSKLADLGKSVAGVSGIADKVGQFEGRLTALDGAVKSANDKVAALADEVKNAVADSKKAATSPTAVSVETTKPADDGAGTGAALGAAATLFKAAKYKEADEALKKLVAANPKDARVYYYAALTHGLTTSDWQGEALKIAAKGAELEKSGVSKPADIDAAFTGLPDNLKPWLAFYRKASQP